MPWEGQHVEPGHDCGTCGGLKCMGRENIDGLPRDLCNGSRAVVRTWK